MNKSWPESEKIKRSIQSIFREVTLCRRYHDIVNVNVLFIWLKITAVSAWNFKFQINCFPCLKSTISIISLKYYNALSLSTLHEDVLLKKTTIYLSIYLSIYIYIYTWISKSWSFWGKHWSTLAWINYLTWSQIFVYILVETCQIPLNTLWG